MSISAVCKFLSCIGPTFSDYWRPHFVLDNETDEYDAGEKYDELGQVDGQIMNPDDRSIAEYLCNQLACCHFSEFIRLGCEFCYQSSRIYKNMQLYQISSW